jgi:hypothetical protein
MAYHVYRTVPVPALRTLHDVRGLSFPEGRPIAPGVAARRPIVNGSGRERRRRRRDEAD